MARGTIQPHPGHRMRHRSACGRPPPATGRRPPAAPPCDAAPAALASPAMTFSIVARSEDGNELGVAVASKFLAVGAAVPAAEVGAGAVATQAMANLAY